MSTEHAHQTARPFSSLTGFAWRVRNWFHLPGIVLGLWLSQPTALSVAVGCVVVVAGMAWRTWALGHIRKDETLCTTGPYSLVRHPLYLGNIVVLAGLLIICRNFLLAAVAVAVVTALYSAVIRAEEGFLEERFGDDWREYRKRVPALLPALRKPVGTMDWRLALVNRALLNWLLVGVVAALMAAKPWIWEMFRN